MPHPFRQACFRSHPNCINEPGKALPRTNVNHLLIIAPSNKHADCKIGYTTISTTLFACLSWKVHRPTAVILYSPSDYWLTWLIKILPIMWQICLNLPTKKKKKNWSLTAFRKSTNMQSSISHVAQTWPPWFWSDPVHWYNNNLSSYTHLAG